MNTWFASDHQFGHKNIVDYCQRPFEWVEQMNEALIEDHNAVVAPDDRVYLLGDFSFMEPYETSKILKRMNGKKFLIKGNNDHLRRIEGVRGFADVMSYKELKFGDDHVVLFHWPIQSWTRKQYGAFHLHGHDETLPCGQADVDMQRYDVSVDHLHRINGKYAPVSWDWLRERLGE